MKSIVTNTVHISQNAIIEHKYKIVVTTHNMQYTHDFIGHIYEIIPLTYDIYNIYMELYNIHTDFTTHILNIQYKWEFIEHIYGNIPQTYTHIPYTYQFSHI